MEFVNLKQVKSFFDFKDDEMDELLQFLIQHYTEYITEKTGVTEATAQTKELLLLAIGCHLSKIKAEKVSSTISYTVGDVRERYADTPAREVTWCEAYKYALNEILESKKGSFVVVGSRRKGLSDLNEFQ